MSEPSQARLTACQLPLRGKTSPGRGKMSCSDKRGNLANGVSRRGLTAKAFGGGWIFRKALAKLPRFGVYYRRTAGFAVNAPKQKGKNIMFDIFNMLKKDEHKDAKQVTRDTIIGDILDMDQTTAPYFMEIGMHCLGCPASRGESIEEACAVHGVDCDELIEKLNEHLAAKKA